MSPSNTSIADTKISFWKEIFGYIKPYRLKIFIAIMCSFICGVAVALQPLTIKFIVDEGINRPNSTAQQRFIWASVFAGVYMFFSIIRMGVWWIGYTRLVYSVEGFLFTIRSRFFRHVQGLCFRFHDQVSSGELFNYLMGSPMSSLKNFLHQFVLSVPTQVVTWIIAFCTLLYFDWVMTLVLIVVAIVIIMVNFRSRKVIKVMAANFMQKESAVSKYVADMLKGCREIKIHAIEDQVTENFDKQISQIRNQSINLTLRQQREGYVPEGLTYLGMCIMYCMGAYSCIYRGLTVGELFAFVGSVSMMIGPIMTIVQLNLVKSNAEAGLERVTRVLETESTVEEPDPKKLISVEAEEQIARVQKLPAIEFKNVSFAYGDKSNINNITCRLEHGQSVALVGPSGSGKSTFVRLILRLYETKEGTILFNGRNIKDYSLTDLRSHFGVVSQDTFLFQTTIYENIRVADPLASKESISRAMDMAYVTDFIKDLPKGADTDVGESGFSLSGGQKQRVAIARAVLGNPHYYIFDEATSALDNQSERRIQEAIRELQKDHTIIIIAHRLSTVKHVDKILVFNKGQIVQEGSYSQLSSQPGLFDDLLKSSE